MTVLACCVCGQGIEDVLNVDITIKWNDSFDSQTWYAHDGCLRTALLDAFHPNFRQLEIRGTSGASILASYLEEGPGEEWRRIALEAGFEQPAEDYPHEGRPDDLLDLEEIMALAGVPELRQLRPLLEDARSWGPGALAEVVEQAHRKGVVTAAVIPHVIALVVLLARPVAANEVKEKTNFGDDLVDAIAAVAQDAGRSRGGRD
jgi:hypothetical protein